MNWIGLNWIGFLYFHNPWSRTKWIHSLVRLNINFVYLILSLICGRNIYIAENSNMLMNLSIELVFCSYFVTMAWPSTCRNLQHVKLVRAQLPVTPLHWANRAKINAIVKRCTYCVFLGSMWDQGNTSYSVLYRNIWEFEQFVHEKMATLWMNQNFVVSRNLI